MASEARKLSKAIRKYLDQHAEPEASYMHALADRGDTYAAVVVIPAYAENASLLETLSSIPACHAGRVLVIVVVNERDDSPTWAKTANEIVLDQLHNHPDWNKQPWLPLGPGTSMTRGVLHDLVLIDRTGAERQLPRRQGVGLARKIGADAALALWSHGATDSPWIHCTDADVALPNDYFDRLRSIVHADDVAAALYDFTHTPDDNSADRAAIHEYELYLRYYVLGLRSAGSPYGFHTIGSTIAVHANAYASVRGFPKREAAEDFHLLSKLAKVGRVVPLRGKAIVLSGRESERVPFGTGRAMIQSRARAGSHRELDVYDPRCFRWLEVWLSAQPTLGDDTETSIEVRLAALARNTSVDSTHLCRILDRLGALDASRKALLRGGDTRRSLNESFDALATLKLIHAVRDEVHPDIPLSEALASALFCNVDVGQNPAIQCEALARAERDAPHPSA